MRVRRRAVAQQLGVRDGAARRGDLGRLEDEQRRALAHDEPVAAAVERPRGRAGVVVGPGRQRPDDVERPERQRAQRDLDAARDRGVDPALAQVAHRLAERDRPRGARVRGRQDRPADVERDAEVGRRRATEHGQRQVGRDLADPALEVALVLLLRVGDAAQRGAEVDADPLRVAPRRRPPGRQPRVVERQLPGDEPELAEPVELAGGLGRHPGERVEVVDLGRDLRCGTAIGSNRSIRLTGERAARRPARNASRPVPMAVIDADPGDPDAPPLAQRGSSGALGHGASGLGEGLERGQRPSRDGSREGPVDERRERRESRAEVVVDRDVAAGSVGSIRQVTSIPLVAPGDMDEPEAARRGLVPGPRAARRPGSRDRGRRRAASAAGRRSRRRPSHPARRSTARDRA